MSSILPAIDPSSANQPHRDADFARLGFVDLKRHASVDVFMDMVARLSKADTPMDVMNIYGQAVRKARGEMALITLSCKGLKPGQYRVTRQIDYDWSNIAESNDPWRDRDRLTIHTGGILGRLIATNEPKLATDLRIDHDPVLGAWLAPYRSLAAVPNFIDGLATHWSIILRKEPGAFSVTDLEEFIIRGNLIGATVMNKIIERELRDLNQRMQMEVEKIASIQRALLPRVLPKIPGLAVAASYETFDVAGGDMYDFVYLPTREDPQIDDPKAPWAFLIADVSGHGPAAAVLAAMLNAILYSYPTTPDASQRNRPSDVLAYANSHLCAKRIDESFVTAVLASYEPDTRRFTWCRAGHPFPIVKTKGKPLITLTEGAGLPLGILDDAVYESESIILEPGQTVVLYTDGIIESLNPRGEEFGFDGVERALEHCSGEPDCAVGSIMKALRDHEGGHRPKDDQTIVAFQVN